MGLILTHSKILRSKKGWLVQVVLSLVILFAVALVWFLTLFTQQTLNTQIQASDQLDNTSKAAMQEQVDAAPNTFDDGIGLVAVIIWLIVMGFAYKAPNNPFLLVAVIVVIAAVGLVSMILANIWIGVTGDAAFATTLSGFPIANFLLSNYLIYLLVLFFSGMVSYAYGSGGVG